MAAVNIRIWPPNSASPVPLTQDLERSIELLVLMSGGPQSHYR